MDKQAIKMSMYVRKSVLPVVFAYRISPPIVFLSPPPPRARA